MDDDWWQEGTPSKPGWYPTLFCYDTAEGVFPSENWWDGALWYYGGTIKFGPRCESKEEARELAIERDPER